MRHLGVSKYNSKWGWCGWDDDDISNQIDECNSIGSDYDYTSDH